MSDQSVFHNSEGSQKSGQSGPAAEGWLPDLGDGAPLTGGRSWSDLTPRERRIRLVKTGLLMLLSLTLALHPSSGAKNVVVWSSFLFVLVMKRRDLFSKRPDPLSLAILVYAVIVGASVVYSVHRRWSARDASKFFESLAFLAAAWYFFRNRRFLFGFLQLLIGSVLVACLYDAVTYFHGLGTEWQWGERWVFGPYYGHPNTASAIIMLLLPISVFLFVTSRSVWLKVMHGCFLVLVPFLMYVMASRTAQVSLLGMIVCTAFLVRPRKRKVIALGSVGCLLVIAFLNVRSLNPRFLDNTAKTLTFRQENWSNMATLIVKRPVFGYGYGKRNYQTIYHRRFASTIPYQHAHSQFFQTVFESGFVGLGALVWVWALTVSRLLGGYFRNRDRFGGFYAALLVSFVGISIYSLTEVPDGFLRSLAWLIIAIAGVFVHKSAEMGSAGARDQG
jgi:O-antigen ligase